VINAHLAQCVHTHSSTINLDLVRVHGRVGNQNLGILNSLGLRFHDNRSSQEEEARSWDAQQPLPVFVLLSLHFASTEERDSTTDELASNWCNYAQNSERITNERAGTLVVLGLADGRLDMQQLQPGFQF
jgi:hypothetical protein